MRKWLVIICISALLLLWGASQASIGRGDAIIIVDTTADVIAVDGYCSMREAVIAANTDSAFNDCPAGNGADTIEISPSLPTPVILSLTLTGTDEDDAQTGDLDIAGALTITGAGEAATILDGNNIDRVLEILPGAWVAISDLTIRNGNPGSLQDGGGILVEMTGSLVLTNTLITQNIATRGAGIQNLGGLTATDSTVENNQGGGIDNLGGSLTLTAVNIAGNTNGSGIRNWGAGILNFSNGLVDGNLGGGIYNNQATATLSGLTIINNQSNGGVVNTGAIATNLTLNYSSVMSNTATSGAGVFNLGLGAVATINETRISANQASQDGGGVYNNGSLTIVRSTIDRNNARSGGGIDHRGGSLQITNATISGNGATDNGGGIYNASGVNMNHVTLVHNTAQGNGGAIFNDEANAYPKNTIIALNPSVDGNCSNAEFSYVISQGYNLDDDDTCSLTVEGDLPNADPVLGPLQDNGGSTYTHALLTGSQAINSGNNTGCPSTDQRGVPRPQGAICDIGSYELIFGDEADLSVTKVDALDPITVGDNITYTLTVNNSGPDSAQNIILTDDLPGSVVYLSAIPAQGSCDQAGGVVTCNLGDLPNGGNTSVEIVATTTIAGTLTNHASVTADSADPDPGNNVDSEQTNVQLRLSAFIYLPLILRNSE